MERLFGGACTFRFISGTCPTRRVLPFSGLRVSSGRTTGRYRRSTVATAAQAREALPRCPSPARVAVVEEVFHRGDGELLAIRVVGDDQRLVAASEFLPRVDPDPDD